MSTKIVVKIKSASTLISYISFATVNGGLLLKVGDNNNTLAVCNVLACKVSMCIYKYIYMIIWLYINTIDIRLQKHNIKYLQTHTIHLRLREKPPFVASQPFCSPRKGNPASQNPIRSPSISIRGTRSEVRQLDGRGFWVSTSNCSARFCLIHWRKPGQVRSCEVKIMVHVIFSESDSLWL